MRNAWNARHCATSDRNQTLLLLKYSERDRSKSMSRSKKGLAQLTLMDLLIQTGLRTQVVHNAKRET